MKRYIFSSVALAAASMLAWGENPKNLVITDIEDQTTTFDASEVERKKECDKYGRKKISV